MKQRLILLTGVLVVIVVLGGVLVVSAMQDAQPVGKPDYGRLIFNEDFNGNSLNTDWWSTCYWWEDDGCTNAGNNELEWYLPENVIVSDGTVKLRAYEERVRTVSGERFFYSSGMISTGMDEDEDEAEPKFAFEYGYVEMRAKIPAGQGLWPAFWLLPDDFTSKPEIDIMEILGHEPDLIHMVLHYLDEDEVEGRAKDEWRADENFSDDFHVFAVDWQPDMVIWYVDGVERARTAVLDGTDSKPMYIIANLAVGGDWPGSPDDTTVFPADYEIDYIRVWQKESC
jgi:beta-glucanase (GH16 family)